MGKISDNPLLEVTDEEFHSIRRFFDIDDDQRIQEGLKSILEWSQKQDHIVDKNISLSLIERLLILSRGSVEVTKSKLDKFCTLRGMAPEIVTNRTVEEFDGYLQCCRLVPLPKLSRDLSRVTVIQFLNVECDDFTMLAHARYTFLIGEYRLLNDYALGETIIIDLGQVSAKLLLKINPIILHKMTSLWTEGYGGKIMGIHFVNAPSYIDKVVFLVKQGVKEKVANRVQVHKTFADLHSIVPKTSLPSDFGGDLDSIEVFSAKWQEELRSKRVSEALEKLELLITDESKRSESKFNEEYLGMPGSFRTLSVD